MKSKLLMLLVAFVIFSCSKETTLAPTNVNSASGMTSNTTTTIEPLATNLIPIITTGVWYVSSYTTPLENKTKNFSKLTMTLTASTYGGTVTLNDGGKISVGTWTSQGLVYYGVPSSYGLQEWSYNLGKSYNLLSKSWLIREITETSVTYDSANPAEGITLVLMKK